MKGKTKIIVKGHIDSLWMDHIEGMEIQYHEDCSIITGTPKDQAHLHGILNLIRDLNIKLISVKCE